MEISGLFPTQIFKRKGGRGGISPADILRNLGVSFRSVEQLGACEYRVFFLGRKDINPGFSFRSVEQPGA